MAWKRLYLEPFKVWLDRQNEDLQDEALARLEMLKVRGPLFAHPYADTLNGSKIANLKEIRFSHNGAPTAEKYYALHLERQITLKKNRRSPVSDEP